MFILGFLLGCLFCVILFKYQLNGLEKLYNERLDYWSSLDLYFQKLWLDSIKKDDADWWKGD